MNTPEQKNTPGRQRTIGPVQDLERHIPPEWWRTLFHSIYLKTDGDVVENDRNTIAEIDTIVDVAGLRPGDKILDLCCGQGRHSLELAGRGYSQITGLDRSRYLIRLARQRAKKMHLPTTFREGDARQFRFAGQEFDHILILGNSFGYFEREEDDLKVLKSCARALSASGTIVLDITDGDWIRSNFEKKSWEWIDQVHFVCRERSLSADDSRLITREVVTHAERGVIADQFYAERLYSETAIQSLLKRAGFEEIKTHGQLQAESSRGTDLGMMSRRIILTAKVAKGTDRKRIKRIVFPRVTVLMGDPRMADDVKRDGHFNPEDFDTISKLKSALGELAECDFSYFDDHAQFLDQLKSNPPEFALNLCDEGYNNNAFLELHVPAYLEMLGVPYSGAGPTCLGMCYNKSLVRAVAEALDIPTPLETYYSPSDQAMTLPAIFPALVKPNFGDSSIGITKDAVVHNSEQLLAYVRTLSNDLPGRPILIQEYLPGAEYSVGIVGNPEHKTTYLPILEVDYSNLPDDLPPILGYESKWEPDSAYWSTIKYKEAVLQEDTYKALQDRSMALFEHLGCRDYARFDYRADADGNVKLLEVNPNPGWCWDGKLNFMAEYAGLSYADLLRLIIEAAQDRLAVKGVTLEKLIDLARIEA